MPKDVHVGLPLGQNGLDLRSSVTELEPGDLVDSLNWQLDRTGALLKRRGFSAWSVAAPDVILRLATLKLSGGTVYVVAHCGDGIVYWTTDGSAWTSIDSGLATTAGFGWAQYMDNLYYCDGASAVRQWNGTTLTLLPTADVNAQQTITITGTPTSGSFTLSYGGYTTIGINYNGAASDVATALAGLTSIGTGNVSATGGAFPGTPVVVTFKGALAARPIALMTHTDSLSGGTAPAVTITTTTVGKAIAPQGNLLTVWRDRLWISGVPATPRRVFWSVLTDATSFINKTNYVDFPDSGPITAIATGPNVGLGTAGADGVLVFTAERFHRIYDDSDNIAGVSTGGANLLVDATAGALGPHVIAQAEGSLWFLSEHGFHSTDGHGVEDEATRVLALLQSFSWSSEKNFCAFGLNGRYYLAFTPVGQASNTRLLEAYADLFRIGWIRRRGGQHQWMAHDVPIASAVVVETPSGETCYFADASSGDGQYVRQLFVGGTDADGASDMVPITATARTGANLFGIATPKRVRRAELYGTGTVTMSIGADLESGVGESNTFDMRVPTRVWSLSDYWGSGVWGGGGGARRAPAYYSKRGRFLTFTLTESSSNIGVSDRVLGYAGHEAGGAAIYSIMLKLTPLDAD